MSTIIGPIQIYPLGADTLVGCVTSPPVLPPGISTAGVWFNVVQEKSPSTQLKLEKVELKTNATTDAEVIKEAKVYFGPMYLGVRVCAVDGNTYCALALDLSKGQDPITAYDRAMAIIGKR